MEEQRRAVIESRHQDGKKGFITFEGIEGSGKTSQLALLAQDLRGRGIRVRVTREPGGTPVGDLLRSIILGSQGKGMAPMTELFLIAACRAQHVTEVIGPALEMGEVVLCDRFTDATLAYQGYGRGLDLSLVREVSCLASGGMQPGLTILLDCPVEMGLERSRKRLAAEGKFLSEGRFEQEERSFHQRVRQGYLELAREDPERIKVLDASAPAEVVARAVSDQVMKHLGV
ncbi:MAG: dTMP kinase [bacterium]